MTTLPDEPNALTTPPRGAWNAFIHFLESYLPIITLGGFVLGLAITALIPAVGGAVQTGIGALIDLYVLVAPLAIFVVLAPSLYRMLSHGQGRGRILALRGIASFSVQRILASIWGVVFTGMALALPWSVASAGPDRHVLDQHGIATVGSMLLYNPYFLAVYAAVAAVAFAFWSDRVASWLLYVGDLFESAGQALLPVVPVFMLAVGAYVYSLPASLAEQFGGNDIVSRLHPVWVFGLEIDPATPWGMIGLYLARAGLTGAACLVWHGFSMLLTRLLEPRFNFRTYIREYWMRVYPLLWSSSSEALATPLNLYLVRKHYGWVSPEVRRFVIGVGSFASVNGTMMCIFIMTGIVAHALGLPLSAEDLFLLVPLVFILGFGVPGIPGELVLFVGPIATMLGLAEPVAGVFITLFIGLQIGLADSFRSGNNSTDSCLTGIRLNRHYAPEPASFPDAPSDVIPVPVPAESAHSEVGPQR